MEGLIFEILGYYSTLPSEIFTLLLEKSRKVIVVYDSLFEPKSFDFEREESIVTVVLRMIDRKKANSFFFTFSFPSVPLP